MWVGGTQLAQMKSGSNTLHFTYDANGTPMTLTWNGEIYYFYTNIQGDVIGLFDQNLVKKVGYTYDAWGNPISDLPTTGIGALNPLRYKGYVYDVLDASDYAGLFFGANTNMIQWVKGIAFAPNGVRANTVAGNGYLSATTGASVTYYFKQDSDWVYGKADINWYTPLYSGERNSFGQSLIA